MNFAMDQPVEKVAIIIEMDFVIVHFKEKVAQTDQINESSCFRMQN